MRPEARPKPKPQKNYIPSFPSSERRGITKPAPGSASRVSDKYSALSGTVAISQAEPPQPLELGRIEKAALFDNIKEEFRSRFDDFINSQFFEQQSAQSNVPQTPAGVRQLIKSHKLKEACSLIESLFNTRKTITPFITLPPHEWIDLSIKYISILRKLAKNKQAYEHVLALGELDSNQYCYESYPQFYNNLKGNFIPIELRVIEATVPRYVGQIETSLNQLYSLLGKLKADTTYSLLQKQVQVESNNETNTSDDLIELDPLRSPFKTNSVKKTPDQEKLFWEQVITFSIVEIHLSLKQYCVAISLLHQLTQTDPLNSNIYYLIGRIRLQMGMTQIAKQYFQKADELRPNQSGISLSSHLHQGFLCMNEGRYSDALNEFELVSEFDAHNIDAANNKSICYLQLERLSEAIATLEDLVVSDPYLLTHESVVHNLCALYDLQNETVWGKKEVIWEILSVIAPDAIDFAMLRLPQK
eukprot:c11832_g1_i1.p1 GENE.c11832_g1_i1~~c11832_g1_i1.p1  ORF type:complete len:473 (-),score=151.09 c11832_g1_i1:25-1443(-)